QGGAVLGRGAQDPPPAGGGGGIDGRQRLVEDEDRRPGANARTRATCAAWPPESAGTGTSARAARPAASRSSAVNDRSRVAMVTAPATVAVRGSPGRWVSRTTPRSDAGTKRRPSTERSPMATSAPCN